MLQAQMAGHNGQHRCAELSHNNRDMTSSGPRCDLQTQKPRSVCLTAQTCANQALPCGSSRRTQWVAEFDVTHLQCTDCPDYISVQLELELVKVLELVMLHVLCNSKKASAKPMSKWCGLPMVSSLGCLKRCKYGAVVFWQVSHSHAYLLS